MSCEEDVGSDDCANACDLLFSLIRISLPLLSYSSNYFQFVFRTTGDEVERGSSYASYFEIELSKLFKNCLHKAVFADKFLCCN